MCCGVVLVVLCVVLFFLCVCVGDLFLFLQKQRNTVLTLAHAQSIYMCVCVYTNYERFKRSAVGRRYKICKLETARVNPPPETLASGVIRPT